MLTLSSDGRNVRLGESKEKKLKKAIEALKNFEPSKECQDKVLKKLEALGFDLGEFKKFLEKGFEIYDITRSDVSVVGSLFDADGARARGYTAANTISGTFRDRIYKEFGRTLVDRTNAQTSINSQTFLTYVHPDAVGDDGRNQALMFHEALHGFLTKGRTDQDLSRALFNGEEKKLSGDITNLIEKHCFKN